MTDLFSSRWCRHSSCHDWTIRQCKLQPWLAFHRTFSSPAAPVGHELGGATSVLFVEVRPHHSSLPATALADSTGEDPVQACCSRVQLSVRDNIVVWSYLADNGWFRDPETPSFLFLTDAECPSYTAAGCPPSAIGSSLLLLPALNNNNVCMYWFIYYCQYRSNITDNKLQRYK